MGRRRGIHIELGNINVNRIDSSSGIFVGTNAQWGWSSHAKNVSGFGAVTGMLNRLSANVSVVYDNDLIDTPIDDRDVFIASPYAETDPPTSEKPPTPQAKSSSPADKGGVADKAE